MTRRWIIGLASGSTVDGVDAALLELDGAGLDLRLRPLHTLHQPYPRDLRDLLLRVGQGEPTTAKQISLLHRLLGESFAAAARQVADQASFSLPRVQCVGCPGHGLWHEPEGRYPSTLAAGMAAVVAEGTGLTVVSDFRGRDVAVGGQGAPLSALVDYLLFRDAREHRLLLHLGGLVTAVFLPAGGAPRQVLGFQAGPCNVLLDGLIRALTAGREAFDAGGKHAVQGCCIDELLERWLAHPLLQRRAPAGLTPQAFGDAFVRQTLQLAVQRRWGMHDLLCTATHFVARAAHRNVQRTLPAPPGRVLLSGGGVRNGLLWHLLGQQFVGVSLETVDRHGVPYGARQAVAHGGLAALTVDGVPANLMTATGASGSRLLGSLTPGGTGNWARCAAWMATQTAPLRALAAHEAD
jgi:anhydro-N-acetylmuramic acid kinase